MLQEYVNLRDCEVIRIKVCNESIYMNGQIYKRRDKHL